MNRVTDDLFTQYLLHASQFTSTAALAILATLLLYLSNELYYRSFGRFKRHSILITGMAGVPVHETSHLLAAILFRFDIHRVAFFDPDPRSGTLGYVNFSYRSGLFQKLGLFVTGLAPLIGGVAVVIFLFDVADIPNLSDFLTRISIDQAVVLSLQNWFNSVVAAVNSQGVETGLLLLLSVMVGVHATPSRADLRGVVSGFLASIFLLIIALFVELLLIRSGFFVDPILSDFLSLFAVGLIQLAALSALFSVALSSFGYLARVIFSLRQ